MAGGIPIGLESVDAEQTAELLALLREACAYIYSVAPTSRMPSIHQRACELIARVEGRAT